MGTDWQKRFFKKFTKKHQHECWEWFKGKTTAGYGMFHKDKFTASYAHRISYELHVGPIPKGMCVCHACDNPACVNPSHLFLGTHLDNMRDMNKKGRHAKDGAKGEKNAASKLENNDIPKIKNLLNNGCSLNSIARKFLVSKKTIFNIKKGRIWKHI